MLVGLLLGACGCRSLCTYSLCVSQCLGVCLCEWAYGNIKVEQFALLPCDTFKRSLVPSAAACSCSSSPLPFLPLLHLLFLPRASASSPALSPWLALPWCHRGGGGCAAVGIPELCSAGRGCSGESAPSRPRTRVGSRRSDRTNGSRTQEGDWPRGSKQRGGRWRRSSGSHVPPLGSDRHRHETAQPDESGCPARSPPAGHLLPTGAGR